MDVAMMHWAFTFDALEQLLLLLLLLSTVVRIKMQRSVIHLKSNFHSVVTGVKRSNACCEFVV